MWDNNRNWLQNTWDGISSGFSQIGKNIGNFWNDLTGRSQMARFNAVEAQKQRNFEKSMSDTSLQRAVADAKLAGINPASIDFSAQGGFTPSGSAASAPQFGSDAGQFLTGVVRSALSIALFKKFAKASITGGNSAASVAAKAGSEAAAADASFNYAVERQFRKLRFMANRYTLGGHATFSPRDLSRFKL